ncbi:hypothetical protein JW835_03330 [bacterium]|nr:hypothetical protein [bacterium]
MKVAELIQKLQTFPQDAELMILSYEDGFDPVTECRKITVKPSSTTDWYYGLYDESEQGTPAVLIASKFTRAEKEGNHV